MAKYCVQCGNRLPDGVEICPDCNRAATESGAALFTRMTAETEVWKEDGAKKPKRIRFKRPSQPKKLALGLGAAAACVLLLVVILMMQPSARIGRALRAGEFDKAAQIYWGQKEEKRAERSPTVDKHLLAAADRLCEEFARHDRGAEETAEALAKLGNFGDGAAELLEVQFARFRTLNDSHQHMTEAEKLTRNGEYLAAREEYLLVIEEDTDYAAAQEQAEESLKRYAGSVLSDANIFIQSGDLAAAITTLQEGNRTLYGYGEFSAEIDTKLKGTLGLYEEHTLESAEGLAKLEDYAAAAELIRAAMERFELDSSALTAALELYSADDRAQEIRLASARAAELLEAEDFAAAFAEVDALAETLGAGEDIEAAVTALEDRFAEQRIAKAEELFAGARETLPDAVALLDEALKAREVEAIALYREEIAQYLPLHLAEAELLEKDGTIFRSSNPFEALNGVWYGNWLWGDNGASLSWELGGNYDMLEATFAMRRDDNRNANAHFVVYCDGEEIYKSATLHHWETDVIDLHIDISGCETLKISFVNDYSVSTASGGYCYHGLCDARALKNLED